VLVVYPGKVVGLTAARRRWVDHVVSCYGRKLCVATEFRQNSCSSRITHLNFPSEFNRILSAVH